jgi:hypothetical protein
MRILLASSQLQQKVPCQGPRKKESVRASWFSREFESDFLLDGIPPNGAQYAWTIDLGIFMKRYSIMLLMTVALAFVGCDKKVSSPSVGKTASASAVSGQASKASVPPQSAATSSSKAGAQDTATPPPAPVKVPKQGKKGGTPTKGELDADTCKTLCTNVVALSIKSVADKALKVQFEAFGLEDCQARCLAKATKKQATCMNAAKSLEALAKCSF